MKKLFKGFLILILIVSCNRNKNTDDQLLLAEVGEHTLYKKEVLESLPKNISSQDSIAFIKNYTDAWVRNKLLYEKAISNIHDKDGTIEGQVARFREQLYITAYEQLFSNQKLDTIIPQNQIDEYYSNHKQEYILNVDVVKPIFAVIPKQKLTTKIKKYFYSKDIDEFDIFKDFVYENSQKFYLGKDWVVLEQLKQEVPVELISNANIFDSKGIILEDSQYAYCIKITEYVKAGNPKPKEMAYEEIATILLHKRKIELLKSMRNKLYQDALHKQYFQTYY
ncbi:MAG TPA: hypothetical protein P5243_02280 [Bacteroidales bacterium]|jgi:hypothetical protein|nr:hypothetical protein [Bacteroidales bacterium]HRS18305.1 hypothetical protein [Bacteroidales bacterium]